MKNIKYQKAELTMIKKTFAIFIMSLFLIACQSKRFQDSVDLNIDNAFTKTPFEEDSYLKGLTNKVLANDKSALKQIIHYNCGGGSACYDLGFIMAELIYKMGENNFINLLDALNPEDRVMLDDLIGVGLEYGYEPNSSRQFETAFPNLYRILHKN